MKGLLIAEKPSVMREIQSVYGKEASKLPFSLEFAAFHGHLMGLQNPEDYDPAWSKWEQIPVIPAEFKYKAVDVKSVSTLADKIKNGKYDFLVNACDAGREGEHIFWSFYETLGLKLPVKRFWATSVTTPAIKKALHDIQDSVKYDGLRQSAKYRAQLDWLVGMNFTRAATVRHGELTSIGRVQTPTLKLIVDRELQIRNFVPEEFYELKGTFKINGVDAEMVHLIAPDLKNTRFSKKEDAAAIEADVKKKAPGTVLGMKNETKSTPAPTLYSLTELQKAANRHLKFKPDKTLEIAQKLYEGGLLTYPRTESRFLPTDMIPEIADHIAPLNSVPDLTAYASAVGQAEIDRMLKGKYVDDAGITDHHAIIPTDQNPNWAALSKDEQALYTLVGKSFLAIFMLPHVVAASSILVGVGGHMFRVRGNADIDPGYTVLYPSKKGKKAASLPVCKKGDRADLVKTKIAKGITKAPERYNPDTILSAMLHAGQALSDDAMRSVLRETEGLGTPATRAEILKKLEAREYVKFEKNAYYALDKGIHLIGAVGGRTFSSAALTAEWEKKLLGIEKGTYQGNFRQEMEQYTKDETAYLLSNLKSTVGQVIGVCPFCGANVVDRGKLYACENRVAGNQDTCQFRIPKELGGHEITQDDIEKLLAGKETEQHHFTHPKTKRSWDAALVPDREKGINFSFPSIETAPRVGFCPFCGGEVKAVGRGFICVNKKKDDPTSCQVSFSKEICGYEFTKEDVQILLSGGETDVKQFTSKGKSWRASVVLTEKGGVDFHYEDDSIGTCPFCGGRVRSIGKAYICENKKKDDPSSCQMNFPKEIGGYRFTEEDLEVLLEGEETGVKQFASKGKKWKASVSLNEKGGLSFTFENNSIGECPLCGSPVYAAENRFYCSANNCWTFPRIIKGAKLSDKDAATLLRGQRTRSMTFTWRNGQQGTASLYLDDDGKPNWTFQD